MTLTVDLTSSVLVCTSLIGGNPDASTDVGGPDSCALTVCSKPTFAKSLSVDVLEGGTGATAPPPSPDGVERGREEEREGGSLVRVGSP